MDPQQKANAQVSTRRLIEIFYGIIIVVLVLILINQYFAYIFSSPMRSNYISYMPRSATVVGNATSSPQA